MSIDLRHHLVQDYRCANWLCDATLSPVNLNSRQLARCPVCRTANQWAGSAWIIPAEDREDR